MKKKKTVHNSFGGHLFTREKPEQGNGRRVVIFLSVVLDVVFFVTKKINHFSFLVFQEPVREMYMNSSGLFRY